MKDEQVPNSDRQPAPEVAHAAPIIDENTPIGPERKYRFVLDQQPAKPAPTLGAQPDPDPIILNFDPPANSQPLWIVVVLLIVTFGLGTTALALMFRGTGVSANPSSSTPSSAQSSVYPTSDLPGIPSASISTQNSSRQPLPTFLSASGGGDGVAPTDESEPFRTGLAHIAAPSYAVMDLGVVAQESGAGLGHIAINDLGQVGLTRRNGAGERRAFIWSQGRLTDLGSLGGAHCEIRDLNNLGQATGFADTADGKEERAFIWSAGAMTDLGTLTGNKSFGLAISDRATVVGTALIANNTDYHAFVWDTVRGMRDLNEAAENLSGLILTTAYGINADGLIVGAARTPQGNMHAFTLWDKKVTDLGELGLDSYACAVNGLGQWDPLESTCRHASLSIL